MEKRQRLAWSYTIPNPCLSLVWTKWICIQSYLSKKLAVQWRCEAPSPQDSWDTLTDTKCWNGVEKINFKQHMFKSRDIIMLTQQRKTLNSLLIFLGQREVPWYFCWRKKKSNPELCIWDLLRGFDSVARVNVRSFPGRNCPWYCCWGLWIIRQKMVQNEQLKRSETELITADCLL